MKKYLYCIANGQVFIKNSKCNQDSEILVNHDWVYKLYGLPKESSLDVFKYINVIHPMDGYTFNNPQKNPIISLTYKSYRSHGNNKNKNKNKKAVQIFKILQSGLVQSKITSDEHLNKKVGDLFLAAQTKDNIIFERSSYDEFNILYFDKNLYRKNTGLSARYSPENMRSIFDYSYYYNIATGSMIRLTQDANYKAYQLLGLIRYAKENDLINNNVSKSNLNCNQGLNIIARLPLVIQAYITKFMYNSKLQITSNYVLSIIEKQFKHYFYDKQDGKHHFKRKVLYQYCVANCHVYIKFDYMQSISLNPFWLHDIIDKYPFMKINCDSYTIMPPEHGVAINTTSFSKFDEKYTFLPYQEQKYKKNVFIIGYGLLKRRAHKILNDTSLNKIIEEKFLESHKKFRLNFQKVGYDEFNIACFNERPYIKFNQGLPKNMHEIIASGYLYNIITRRSIRWINDVNYKSIQVLSLAHYIQKYNLINGQEDKLSKGLDLIVKMPLDLQKEVMFYVYGNSKCGVTWARIKKNLSYYRYNNKHYYGNNGNNRKIRRKL